MITKLSPVMPGQKWNSGNQWLPFHPRASHVPPGYRDGWNDAYYAATGAPGKTIEHAANQLATACHGAAFAAGWWINPKTDIDTRDNPMCFAQKLMLVVSELAEAMEGDRKNLMDDKLPHRPMREVELADALIRIFDLAGAYNMDIGGAIAEKMAFNKVRPDHQMAARSADGGKAY